jgi:hypothetical protein
VTTASELPDLSTVNRRRSQFSLLAAYAFGALFGQVPLQLDWMCRGTAINPNMLAGFSLLGGGAAVASVLAAAALQRGMGARMVRLAVPLFATVVTLEVLYLINVGLLPHDRALAPISILWDLVAVGVASVGVWLASLLQVTLAPILESRVIRVAGALLLVSGVIQVWVAWPREPPIPRRGGEGPNLVVVVIDALRRDHLGLYGYGRVTSPSIDRWGSSGRIYTQAFAASSWTLPSVPVMFGSANGKPGVHPVLDQLKAKGYVVASFSDNPLFERAGPLSSGFDHVEQSTAAAPRMLRALFGNSFLGDFVIMWPWLARKWDDARLIDRVLRWTDEVEGPFLLYVHLMDTHMPYRRPAIDGRGWRHRRLESLRAGTYVSPEEASDIVAHYDGGIRSADAAVRRLLEAVGRWRRPSLVILTADHGESLGEDSRWGHGLTLAPELLDVPLIVGGEGVKPGRVAAPVGQASVAETLLRAAGLPGLGRGATDLRTSEGDSVVEGRLPPNRSYRVADGYELVVNWATGKLRLFDLRRDPHRRDDISRLNPDIVKELAVPAPDLEARQPDAATLERLRALGYVDE